MAIRHFYKITVTKTDGTETSAIRESDDLIDRYYMLMWDKAKGKMGDELAAMDIVMLHLRSVSVQRYLLNKFLKMKPQKSDTEIFMIVEDGKFVTRAEEMIAGSAVGANQVMEGSGSCSRWLSQQQARQLFANATAPLYNIN